MNSSNQNEEKLHRRQEQNQKSEKKRLSHPNTTNIHKKIIQRERGPKQQQTPEKSKKLVGSVSISFQERQVPKNKTVTLQKENKASFSGEEADHRLEDNQSEPGVEVIKIDEAVEFEPEKQKKERKRPKKVDFSRKKSKPERHYIRLSSHRSVECSGRRKE